MRRTGAIHLHYALIAICILINWTEFINKDVDFFCVFNQEN